MSVPLGISSSDDDDDDDEFAQHRLSKRYRTAAAASMQQQRSRQQSSSGQQWDGGLDDAQLALSTGSLHLAADDIAVEVEEEEEEVIETAAAEEEQVLAQQPSRASLRGAPSLSASDRSGHLDGVTSQMWSVGRPDWVEGGWTGPRRTGPRSDSEMSRCRSSCMEWGRPGRPRNNIAPIRCSPSPL